MCWASAPAHGWLGSKEASAVGALHAASRASVRTATAGRRPGPRGITGPNLADRRDRRRDETVARRPRRRPARTDTLPFGTSVLLLVRRRAPPSPAPGPDESAIGARIPTGYGLGTPSSEPRGRTLRRRSRVGSRTSRTSRTGQGISPRPVKKRPNDIRSRTEHPCAIGRHARGL